MINDLKENGQKVRNEVKERTVGYITTALGLVAGLAWNDAIREMIDKVFPVGQNTIIARFLYAVILTIAVVVLSMYVVNKFGGKESDKN